MVCIDVVREAELHAGDSTQGITREKAFEAKGIIVARTVVPRGVSSGWHHHEERHLYAYIVAGRLQLEYGPGGGLAAEVSLGDFFHIPPHLVHRDVNPSHDEPAIVVNILSGEGPSTVNVGGPDAS